MKDAKTIQTLCSVAIIASPVSLVFGGVALSLVTVVCALIARSKLKTLSVGDDDADASEAIRDALARQSKVALIVSIAAFLVNAVFFIWMFSQLLQAMQSGDLSEFMQLFGMNPESFHSAQQANPADTQSIWD